MKLVVGDYEVEIKAKRKFEEKNSKQSAMYFLNDISILCSEASAHYRELGLTALDNWAREMGKEIHNTLKENGF